MSKIERFEDIIAWQKARLLTKAIYEATRQGGFVKDFGLSNQLQRAAVSIMSNLAEGFERSGIKERLQFVTVAKASCAEVRSQLYVAFDIGYLTKEQFDTLIAQSEEVARITGKLRSALERKRDEQNHSSPIPRPSSPKAVRNGSEN